jgi:hypothetical protein
MAHGGYGGEAVERDIQAVAQEDVVDLLEAQVLTDLV